MAKAEAAYAAGQLTNPEIAAVDALAWAGRTEREIDDWLTQPPLVDGIAETVQWCHAHRLLPVLATLRPGAAPAEPYGQNGVRVTLTALGASSWM
jgi:phosphoserine phosphatase